MSEFPENVEINYSWGKLEYQYTQFVHRSGVILAQITDEGDILLLANRLYNSRLASAKDVSSKFDKQKQGHEQGLGVGLRPPALGPSMSAVYSQMQASGILGLNVQSPVAGGVASPLPRGVDATATSNTSDAGVAGAGGSAGGDREKEKDRISADVLGSKRALGSSGLSTYVTPEQIKDDLEAFCGSKEELEAFYKEVTEMMVLAQQDGGVDGGGSTAGSGNSGGGHTGAPVTAGEKVGGRAPWRQGTGSTSSSLLRPVKESDLEGDGEVGTGSGKGAGMGMGMGIGGIGGIPEFKLPEGVMGRRQRTT